MKQNMEDGSVREIIFNDRAMAFRLHRERYVMQFVLMPRYDSANGTVILSPHDLGRHAPVPCYEGERMFAADCPVNGGTCFYDGSSLNAERFAKNVFMDGEDVVWAELERLYAHVREQAAEVAMATA